ncbi:HAD-IC family P-type ATPase [Lichenicola sp.]|uniref:HAD-IC family P-type ATPase n=1 Tax=Lichenicola sp. TaxID=2804529 RepID=UPI003B00E301
MPDPSPGLGTREAARRLASGGPNTVADIAEHPARRALEKLWAPMPWMLEAAILLQLVTGAYTGAGVVAVLLVSNAALGYFQEGRAQATLDALKSRLALTSAVRRDGTWSAVPAASLVPGDVVKLSLGAVVPADMRIDTGVVLIDQSMLTGESIAVDFGPGADAFAGALVRRGEAVGHVTATGARTRFGRTTELVRSARVVSTQQKTIMAVVRNLVLFNGGVTILLTLYATWLSMPRDQIISLALVAVLASVPVALPAMFTLAAAVGARALARQGVLPTSLSAVDEAAGIDVLCADKTGTLTRNELAVMAVQVMPGFGEAQLLGLAALASSDGGQDPVDAAVRTASTDKPFPAGPSLVSFLPFDPARKSSEATVRRADGTLWRVIKGAYGMVAKLAPAEPGAQDKLDTLEGQGFRVLAVVAGPENAVRLAGFIALSDPPRDDSASLVAELAGLGVRTVMVTGDAELTARVVGAAIGIRGKVWGRTPLPASIKAEAYAIFAGVLPEDKFRLVQALQADRHIVGMCGDGANDAPALRQAQMGIAVSTATDAAKAAAGIVLTQPGLSGIVASVKEGRMTYQRILTYTLRSIIHKVVQVLFLTTGLVVTGGAILTPTLMVLMMVTGDLLAMSSSTDTVHPSRLPSVWHIGPLTIAGIVLGFVDLAFCICCLSVGRFALDLDAASLQTLTVATLVFSGQAVFYVARERRHMWSSRPGAWLLLSSVIDVSIVSVLALKGILMAPLAPPILAGLLLAAVVFSLVLDTAKFQLFRVLRIA